MVLLFEINVRDTDFIISYLNHRVAETGNQTI